MHGNSSAETVQLYSNDAANRQEVHEGAMAWMDYYGSFWAALTRKFS
jgi:hypothetical protein